MNISSTFIVVAAFIAVAYSAPLFSEDEIMNHIREDLLLAKLSNFMEARELGSVPQSLYGSPLLFNPFLSGTGKVNQQMEPSNTDMILDF